MHQNTHILVCANQLGNKPDSDCDFERSYRTQSEIHLFFIKFSQKCTGDTKTKDIT